MTQHVFLIGFMGSGKTTVGRLVAASTGHPFVDLDSRIAESDGRSISEIFAEDGEEAFRDLETVALKTMVTEPASVVSCGGGVIERAGNVDMMRSAGVVVYLEVTEEDVFERVRDDGRRPLLADGAEVVGALLRRRLPGYLAAADITVTTTARDPRQVATEIIRALEAA